MDDGVVTEPTKIGRSIAARPAAPKSSHGRRFYLAAGVLVVLLAGAGAGWWIASGSAAMHYTTAPVTRGTVARAVTATGTINPVLTIIVGSYVSGVIQSLQCDYNTKVTKGQVCAKIDPRPYQAVVDQYKANLAVAKAQLEKDKANLEYTQVNSGRTALLARQKSIAQDTADQSKSVYHQGQAQILLDQATIQQWEAQLAGAQVNLAYTDIISPVDGTVVSRNVTQGQTVAASLQTPTLFLIATDLAKMEVDTNVSESDIGSVKEGNLASFTVEAYPDHPFTGSVVQVRQAPQTLQNVVTFDVVVAVANPDLALKPGMTATTKIVAAQRDNVVRVPDQALRYLPAGAPAAAPARSAAATASAPTATATAPTPTAAATAPAQPAAAAARQGQVWVLANGRPVRVAVTLGLDDDTYTEIVGGELKVGDQVILSEQAGGSGKSAVPLPRL
jgi:HlyD family secretion protein